MAEERINLEFKNCLQQGRIKTFSRGPALASKELDIAVSDLERARKTLKDGDYKWATIQLYYSMFHCARALLLARGYREHNHYCLIVAMRALYVGTKKLPVALIDALQEAKGLRQDADYYGKWSKKGCKKLLKHAADFLASTQKILRPPKNKRKKAT